MILVQLCKFTGESFLSGDRKQCFKRETEKERTRKREKEKGRERTRKREKEKGRERKKQKKKTTADTHKHKYLC